MDVRQAGRRGAFATYTKLAKKKWVANARKVAKARRKAKLLAGNHAFRNCEPFSQQCLKLWSSILLVADMRGFETLNDVEVSVLQNKQTGPMGLSSEN